MNLFDITDEDIAKFNDADLRTLVGLLCEAEIRAHNLPLSGVAWGGDQNAADGGLDAAVNLPRYDQIIDFVPRKNVGYQVKKSDLTPSKIAAEMKPHGKLRPSIKRLVTNRGAYIIVSRKSLSDSARIGRIEAMRNVVARVRGSNNLIVDYFDGSRIATWVRKHPSVILWLRQRINKPMAGWQPFTNWSNKNASINETYVIDNGNRFHNSANVSTSAMSTSDALQEIRSILSSPMKSVRLTGLSGVGKTRFVQALFEATAGTSPLSSDLAIYTDLADSPNPDPLNMVDQLNQLASKNIIIVDNCPPELHRQLTDKCQVQGSKLSLLTIEYDIRDDLPLETEAYIMEPNGDETIKSILHKRFSDLSYPNIDTIVAFSSGNARVAIALASTVRKSESIATLRDEVLFTRLFQQRNRNDDALMKVAEAASLLYSFEGTKLAGEGAEINILSNLVNETAEDFHRKIEVLKRRGLVQTRNVWRAVLPHAIANKLAKSALETISIEAILESLVETGTERLALSFSRRLSFLHESPAAIKIVETWLAPDGWIGATRGNLSSFGIRVLENIAPVAPEAALHFIEIASDDPNIKSPGNANRKRIIRIARLIAFDGNFFDRSVSLLLKFATNEDSNDQFGTPLHELRKLFQVVLSGTHATVNQRSEQLRILIESSDNRQQKIGLLLLESALQSNSIHGATDYSFGARTRDYGYRPKTDEEVLIWYKTFLNLAIDKIIVQSSLSSNLKRILGEAFRGLWRTKLFDLMEDVTRQITSKGKWHDGWVASRRILAYDVDKLPPDGVVRIKTIERRLRPSDLTDQIRVICLENRREIFSFDEFDDKIDASRSWERMKIKATELGVSAAADIDLITLLLPDLLTTDNERLFSFGLGLAKDPLILPTIWESITEALDKIEIVKHRYGLVSGFLVGAENSDAAFLSATLDRTVNHKIFAPIFPSIQSTVGIDSIGLQRLKQSVVFGVAATDTFRNVAYSKITDDVSETDFLSFLALLSTRGAISVILECLSSHVRQREHKKEKLSIKFIDFSCQILESYDFVGDPRNTIDYILSPLILSCVKDRPESALVLCLKVKSLSVQQQFNQTLDETIAALAKIYPLIFLDVFVEGQIEDDSLYYFNLSVNPLNIIDDKIIEEWASKDPTRIPTIFKTIPTTRPLPGTNILSWRSFVPALLEMTPDINITLDTLVASIYPNAWSGSYESVLRDREVLILDLEKNKNDLISAWARTAHGKLLEDIKYEQKRERENARTRYESFE